MIMIEWLLNEPFEDLELKCIYQIPTTVSQSKVWKRVIKSIDFQQCVGVEIN